MVLEENERLGRAMIRGCMKMYQTPTHHTRNKVASELAVFFPLEQEPEQKPPPPKKEEQEAQDAAEQEEEEHAEYLEKLETGIGSDVVTEGRVQYHDHTATVRRPSMRIARRAIPVSQGIGLRFPHRWFLDKAIFSQRLLTEAGIMIDGSGSMRWTEEDMQLLMSKVPAVRVGVYSGSAGDSVFGRFCIIAKDGRFAKFTGLDPEMNGGNDVDFEALQLLARWPKPRLWLSDGMVCGGVIVGPPTKCPPMGYYNESDGLLREKCDSWMKAHEILRVPNTQTMHKLLSRQKVKLYRSTVAAQEDVDFNISGCFPYEAEPVWFQL
jgi:hypothetical protein